MLSPRTIFLLTAFCHLGSPATAQFVYQSEYVNGALVHSIIPQSDRKNKSVVMVPGLNLSSYIYVTTPDGRDGWAQQFAERGYDVHVVNDPRFDFSRGFSVAPFTVPEAGMPPADPSASQGWQRDIWPRWGFGDSAYNPYPDVRFPTDFFDTFADNYPYVSDSSSSLQGCVSLVIRSIDQPVVVMGHSAGGPAAVYGARENTDKVETILLIEPTGPPDSDDFPELAGLNMLGVYADYIDSRNQGSRKAGTEAAAVLFNSYGGVGEVISLPDDLGIHGNTHLMMQDNNNGFISGLIIDWIENPPDPAPNYPPEINPIESLTLFEGDSISLVIRGTDPNSLDALTIFSNDMPPFLHLGPTVNHMANLSIEPLAGHAGEYAIGFFISDGALQDSTVFFLTVEELVVQEPPVFDPVETVTVEQGSTGETPISATDTDSDFLEFSVVSTPGWCSLESTGPKSARLTAVPGVEVAAGDYTVSLKVEDESENSDTIDITIQVLEFVEPNAAPEFQPVVLPVMVEGDSATVPVQATDDNAGDSLVIDSTGLPGFVDLTDNGDRTASLSIHPQPGDAGSWTISLRVSDGSLEDSLDLELVVEELVVVTVPPEFLPVETVILAQGDSKEISIFATDEDSGSLVITATTEPEFSTFQDNGDKSATVILAPGFEVAPQTYTVSLRVEDPNGNFDTTSFDVVVEKTIIPTIAPVFTPVHNHTVIRGSVTSITVSATDEDSSSLVILPSEIPAFASFKDNGNMTATLTFAPGFAVLPDSYPVSLEVLDPEANSDTTGFVVYVESIPGQWRGFNDEHNGFIDTGSLLGWIWSGADPWIWAYSIQNWAYLDSYFPGESGGWVWFLK